MLTSLYFNFLDAQGQLTPKSVVDVLVTCKNKKDPIKIKAIDFPHYKSMGLFFQTLKGS